MLKAVLVAVIGVVTLGAVLATVSELIVRRIRRLPSNSDRARSILLHAFFIGLGWFVLGFLGPAVFLDGSAQAPLFGFVTGPVGVIVGGIVGYFRTPYSSPTDMELDKNDA